MSDPIAWAYPDALPDDFKVLLGAQKVPANDPLIALLAWHTQRINQSHDAILDGTLTLKAALDLRLGKIVGHADTLQQLAAHLESLTALLAEKPLVVSRQIQLELSQPIADSVRVVQQLSDQLASLLAKTRDANTRFQRSQVVAAFLSGFSLGLLLIPWTYSHFFSH